MPEKKNQTIHARIVELTREREAEQESTRALLASAVEQHPLAEEAVEVAEAHLKAIEIGFRGGDAQYTDDDWALATAAVRRTALRLDGAEAELRAARECVVFAHDDVARAFLPVTSKAFPDVETIATCVHPPKPSAGERPLIVVTQEGETVHTGSGMVRAELTLRYFRSAIHTALTASALETAIASTSEVNAQVSFIRSEGAFCDVARVMVSGAVVGVPVIAEIEARYRDAVGRAVVAELVRSTLLWDESPKVDYMSGLWEAGTICAAPYGSATMEQSVDGHTRTLTVENRVAVRFMAPTSDTPLAVVQEAAASLIGTFVGGLGIVEDIEVTAADEDTAATRVLHSLSTKLHVDARDLSWRVRCTLSSAVAATAEPVAA